MEVAQVTATMPLIPLLQAMSWRLPVMDHIMMPIVPVLALRKTLLPLLRQLRLRPLRRTLLALHAPTAGQSWNQHAFAFTLRLWIGRVLASAASTSVETWPTPPTKRSKTSCGAWRACLHGSASTTGRPRGRGGHREGRRFHTQHGALVNPTMLLAVKIAVLSGGRPQGAGTILGVAHRFPTSAKSLRYPILPARRARRAHIRTCQPPCAARRASPGSTSMRRGRLSAFNVPPTPPRQPMGGHALACPASRATGGRTAGHVPPARRGRGYRRTGQLARRASWASIPTCQPPCSARGVRSAST